MEPCPPGLTLLLWDPCSGRTGLWCDSLVPRAVSAERRTGISLGTWTSPSSQPARLNFGIFLYCLTFIAEREEKKRGFSYSKKFPRSQDLNSSFQVTHLPSLLMRTSGRGCPRWRDKWGLQYATQTSSLVSHDNDLDL